MINGDFGVYPAGSDRICAGRPAAAAIQPERGLDHIYGLPGFRDRSGTDIFDYFSVAGLDWTPRCRLSFI